MKGTDRKPNTPPKWLIGFFTWYCNYHLSDAALGDMLELYARRRMKVGKVRANCLFAWNVIQFIQPFAIRKDSYTINNTTMFRNNVRIAWRSMSRQKMFTFIKIGGFALGLAACMVIALFIKNELSYDQYFKDGSNIYRVYNQYDGTTMEKWPAFPASMASILKADFPEVETSGRLIPYNWFNAGNNLMRTDKGTENTYEERFAYADQSLLEILEIPMVYGDQKHALTNTRSIVISRRIADKYFPNENPVGRTIFLNDDTKNPFSVGGVMEDFPVLSHLKFDFLITLAGVEFWEGEQASWCCWNYIVYIKIRPDADIALLEKKMVAVRDKHFIGYLMDQGSVEVEDVRKHNSFRLQPVKDIHLGSDIGDDLQHGDIRYIWIFGGIACFILMLACINFINLSTAKSANRAKEVGLRKVVGSLRSYIVRQFLIESFLYSFISFVVAVIMVWVMLPSFNEMAAKTLTIPWQKWWLFPLLGGAAILVGVIAGIYPSFYLSSFKPADVLKGNVSRGSKSSVLRSGLVVFQFTTSIILVIGTFVVYKQMNYLLTTKIGFDKDQVIMIHGANTFKDPTTFKNELLQLSDVQNVTISNYLPVEGTKRDQNQFWREGKKKEERGVGAQAWWVDADYINTLGIKLREGRNFNKDLASDSQAIIINQKMAKELGLKSPVGERIENWRISTIVGVVEDFHFESLRGDIGPLALMLSKSGAIFAVKVKSTDMQATLGHLTALWNRFMPNQPIRYSFMDENYAHMYADVQRMGTLLACFALLAVAVACLGLFALSAFMVEQRNKEISIRLVLGASLNSVFRLLTGNFIKLVLISFVIAVPIAAYMMNTWLKDFKNKIDLTWEVFVFSGLLSVGIALITVTYQSVRAALVNPAQSLRSE